MTIRELMAWFEKAKVPLDVKVDDIDIDPDAFDKGMIAWDSLGPDEGHSEETMHIYSTD